MHPHGGSYSKPLSKQSLFPDYKNNFSAFNLGDHVGDEPLVIESNRQLLLDYFPTNYQIQWLEQVHSSDLVIVENVTKQVIVADAVVTRKKNIVLAIMTADCLPILLASKSGSEVAAIHGGWKPLAKGIIENTVKKMTTSPNKICAWLGPCIGAKKFEVGADVMLAFTHLSSKFKKAFSLIEPITARVNIDEPKKYLANLPLIAEIQLTMLGIKAIYHEDACTYTEQNRFYSFRRDKNTGRMATLIACV
jgi:YfiH family protein